MATNHNDRDNGNVAMLVVHKKWKIACPELSNDQIASARARATGIDVIYDCDQRATYARRTHGRVQ